MMLVELSRLISVVGAAMAGTTADDHPESGHAFRQTLMEALQALSSDWAFYC